MYDRRDDAGFTLIELIIAVVILGVIIVPLTGAIIDGLNTTTEAQSRLSETRSPMFSSVFFADDAQSVDPGGIQVGGSSPACTTGSGQNVVSFTWLESGSGAPTQYRSSYVIQTAGGKSTLVRNYCHGGSTDTITIAPVLGPALSQCSRQACFSQQFDGAGKPRILSLTASTCDTSGNARC